MFDKFATVAPDVEPTLITSVRDTFAILAPNVGPTSNISILDNFARLLRTQNLKSRARVIELMLK